MASERNISVCACVKSAARRSYADLVGADGKHVLQVLASETAPAGLRDLPAGETLRQVWEQHYLLREDRLRLRIAVESAGLGCAWTCPMIPRLTQATSARWIGRVTSVYLTETSNEELPHLITAVQTTVPDISDAALTEPIQRQLAAKELLPQEHLVDSGYVDDDRVVRSEQERGVALIGPVRPNSSWQAKEAVGYDQSQFRIDWQKQQATCPQGKVSRWWTPSVDRWGKQVISVRFDRAECRACPVRSFRKRAKSEPRHLCLRLQPHHEALKKRPLCYS